MAENKYEFQGSLLLEKKVKRVTNILAKINNIFIKKLKNIFNSVITLLKGL